MNNIDGYQNSEGKIWLNVASSTYVLENFINLDNNIFLRFLKFFKLFKAAVPKKYRSTVESYSEAKEKAKMVRYDCRKALRFPAGSVDHILCSHFLEHVFPDEMERILKDFHRVMKPDATLHVIVPDLKLQAREYLESCDSDDPSAADRFIEKTLLSKKSRGTLKYQLLELRGAFGLQHRWMYDLPSMTKKLQDVGFKTLDENETPSKLYRHNDQSVHVVACK